MGYVIVYADYDEECIVCYDDNKYSYEAIIKMLEKAEQSFADIDCDFFGDYLLEILPSDITIIKSYDIGTYRLG